MTLVATLRAALLATVLALGVVVPAGPATAHNVLVGSTPQDGAVLAAAPSEVLLRFDQAVKQRYAEVAVVGPDGARWDDGGPAVAGVGVTQPVRPLRLPGNYEIFYRVVSADGHPVSGTLAFELAPADGARSGEADEAGAADGEAAEDVAPPAGDAVAPPAGDDATATAASGGWLPVAALVAAGLAVAVAAVLARRSRRAGRPAEEAAAAGDTAPPVPAQDGRRP